MFSNKKHLPNSQLNFIKEKLLTNNMFIDYLLTLIIFLFAYSLIVFRNILKINLPIWAIMLLASVALIALNVVTPQQAYLSVNYNVIVFLFSMFVIGAALKLSGILNYIIKLLISKSSKPEHILWFIVLGIGLMSGILMNDTLALIGTPIILELSRKLNIKPKILLLALAYTVTTGSVLTPIGNPQNLLIAIESGIKAPFITFLYYLTLPTIINLFLLYYILKRFFKKELDETRMDFKHRLEIITKANETVIEDRYVAKITLIVSLLTFLGIIIADILQIFGIEYLNISWISLIGATLLIVLYPSRRELITEVDWGILILFTSMFVLMGTVYNEGILNIFSTLIKNYNMQITQITNVALTSILLSQILSNVPMTFLYLPIFTHTFSSLQAKVWITLAWSSTIAGNLTLLGAASNLIIVELAEKMNIKISYFEFFKYGFIITLINFIILFLFTLILP